MKIIDRTESRDELEKRIRNSVKVSLVERYQTIAFMQYIDLYLSGHKIIGEVGMIYEISDDKIITGPYVDRSPISTLEKPADYSQRVKKIPIRNVLGFKTLTLPDILD